MGCFAGAIVVFAFFAYLLHSAQDMVNQAKKTRSSQPLIERMVNTERVGTRSPASDEAEEATTDIINATRLPALLSGVRRYAADHDGLLPPMNTPTALRAALFPRYVAGAGVFASPRGEKAYLPNPALSGKPLKSFPKPAETVALYEPLDATGPERENRRAVLFLDGSQRLVTPSEWDRLRQRVGLP